jgi:hypothetical protein
LEFELSAGNIAIGTYTLLYITLPEGWGVTRAESPPDVYYTILKGGGAWVKMGEASYYLVNRVRGDVVGLDVRCRPLEGWRPRRDMEGPIQVNTHQAYIKRVLLKPGLFRRRELHELQLVVPCRDTERVLEIRFTGQGEGIDEIAPQISSLRCHNPQPG